MTRADWRRLYDKALVIAAQAHNGQLDRCGRPYIEHPLFVAAQQNDPEARVVGLLHDVLKDSDWTAEGLLRAGIPPSVVENVLLLTHDPAEPYLDYVARIKGHPVAEAVKRADLRHNTDPARQPQPPGEADLARIERYRKAAALLGDR